MELLEPHVERIMRDELKSLFEELGLVDSRLDELRDKGDDESRLEYLVLEAYRRHLLEDIEELVKFASEHEMVDSLMGPSAAPSAAEATQANAVL